MQKAVRVNFCYVGVNRQRTEGVIVILFVKSTICILADGMM